MATGSREEERRQPNMLIAGTPGVGKTTLAERVAEETSLELIDVGKRARERDLVEEYDEELGAHVIDEEQVVDDLEERMQEGGVILDYHACEFFPARWLDAVVVLVCDNTVLYDRLAERGYDEGKVQENVEAEIMRVVAGEAEESFSPDFVWTLESDTAEQFERNVATLVRLATSLSGDPPHSPDLSATERVPSSPSAA